jgi:hypothetical protein
MNETLNPGKYYLGDPSHVLHDKFLIGIWGNLYNYKNGKHYINSYDFAVHNTHKGDGKFVDTKSRIYNVETGVLSLVPIDLIEDINLCKKHGHIFNFTDKIHFIYDDGVFYVKSGKKIITIDTFDHEGNHSDYGSDDPWEEHCENEDGEPIGKTLCHDSDNDSITDENDILFNSDDEDNENETHETSGEIQPVKFNFFK